MKLNLPKLKRNYPTEIKIPKLFHNCETLKNYPWCKFKLLKLTKNELAKLI